MTNYITENDALKDDFKLVGILLYVSAGITALINFLIQDPWGLIDVSLLVFLAYFIHSKQSLNALYVAGLYFLVDCILQIEFLALSPMALIFRGYMLYFMLSTAFKAFRQRNSQKLIPITKQ